MSYIIKLPHTHRILQVNYTSAVEKKHARLEDNEGEDEEMD